MNTTLHAIGDRQERTLDLFFSFGQVGGSIAAWALDQDNLGILDRSDLGTVRSRVV